MTNYEIFLNCIEKAEQHKDSWSGDTMRGAMDWWARLKDEEKKILEENGGIKTKHWSAEHDY